MWLILAETEVVDDGCVVVVVVDGVDVVVVMIAPGFVFMLSRPPDCVGLRPKLSNIVVLPCDDDDDVAPEPLLLMWGELNGVMLFERSTGDVVLLMLGWGSCGV